jgi:hypothetical protein
MLPLAPRVSFSYRAFICPREFPCTKKKVITLTRGFRYSTWGDRSINFGVYLILATIFPSTLLPASIYGFCVTGAGILFSSAAGTAVDKYHRLTVLRSSTLVQKLSAGIVYGLCLLFFVTSLGSKHTLDGEAAVVFVAIVISGAFTKVSTVCINICIERDWASTIGGGSSTRLTRLNAWLRRIVLSSFCHHVFFPTKLIFRTSLATLLPRSSCLDSRLEQDTHSRPLFSVE